MFRRLTYMLLVPIALGAPVQAANSELLRALQDELQRSMSDLHVEELPKPYFISYTVHTDHSASVDASNGGIENLSIRKSRSLQVEVRVGSRELDNTNFFSNQVRNFRGSTSLSLEDDYEQLRKQIWLATDRTYRQSVDVYAVKLAALQNTAPQEREPDFSEETPYTHEDKRKSKPLDLNKIRETARDLSKLANKHDFLYDNRLLLFANQHLDTYLNSEGSYFTRVDDTAYIRASAWTQADDGRYLTDHVAITGRSWQDVLNPRPARKQINLMYDRLARLQEADTLERYNGPVLLQNQAAAEFVAQTLAQNFLNYKQPVFPSTNIAAAFQQMFQGRTFKDKLGARVLPRSWNVYDDPTIDNYGGEELIGQYPVDSDGLETQRVQLVEKGILKTLLSDRNPTKNILQSSASNATSSGPTPSNLIVETTAGVSQAELHDEFMQLVSEYGNEYGIRVDYVPTPLVGFAGIPSPYSGFRFGTALPTTTAYKVYPDGTEELVRNAIIASPLVPELRNLPAYSEDVTVHSGVYSYQSGDVSLASAGFPVYVSVVAPDILIEDATIINQEGIIRTIPIVPHPDLNN